MKTDGEKLIELIAECEDKYPCRVKQDYREFKEYLADYLISKSITIPVRCEECIYWNEPRIDICSEPKYGDCLRPLGDYGNSIETYEDDFCSYGQRKEND